MPADPSLDLDLLREIVLELIRRGAITDEMIGAVERRFQGQAADSGDDRYAQLAHMARLLPAEAAAPTQSEWDAERRRKRMRVVSSDGGKAET